MTVPVSEMEEHPERERIYHRLFRFGIIVKGINGLLQTIGGIWLLFLEPATVSAIVVRLTRREFLRSPEDPVVRWLRHAFSHLTLGEEHLLSAYLLAHGILKIFLVTMLMRGKLWAYPVTAGFLICFIVFQAYRASLQFSWVLIILAGFDLFVTVFILHEYYEKCRAASLKRQ